jgi:hypothetical protein
MGTLKKLAVGAGGNISLSMSPSGDVVITVVENDTDSSETLSIALHPAILQAELIKLAGGGAFASTAIAFIMASIPAVVAAIPA